MKSVNSTQLKSSKFKFQNNGDPEIYVFEGNDAANDISSNKIDVMAKAMRICPINDPDLGDPEVAMRVEFYVCPPCGESKCDYSYSLLYCRASNT